MPLEDSIDISVLVPVFNEIDGIGICHNSLTSALETSGFSYEIVYVDDGSTDGSTSQLRELAYAQPERVTFVKLLYNVGQQRAMFAGLAHCRGRVVVTFDVDLQFHPECIAVLARKILDGYDIAGGIRTSRKDPMFANKIPSWIGKYLINKALQIDQQDFGAVKAYSARIVNLVQNMRAPLVVIPAMAYSVSRNMIEIPVLHQPRRIGYSKWSVLARIETYLDIYTLYAKRPFAWMLLTGLGSLVLSLILAVGILGYKFLVTSQFSGLIIFFDVFLLATGIFLFSLSLIGEFVVRSLRSHRIDENSIVEEVVQQSL